MITKPIFGREFSPYMTCFAEFAYVSRILVCLKLNCAENLLGNNLRFAREYFILPAFQGALLLVTRNTHATQKKWFQPRILPRNCRSQAQHNFFGAGKGCVLLKMSKRYTAFCFVTKILGNPSSWSLNFCFLQGCKLFKIKPFVSSQESAPTLSIAFT